MKNKTNFGLKHTKHDPRDYHYSRTFGSPVVDLPMEYMVGTCPIKNQGPTEFCTAFAANVLGMLEDNKDFSPEWFFAKEAQLSGQTDGQDLRTPCKTAVKYGFLPQILAQNNAFNQTAVFLANSANWPNSDDLVAAGYKRASYFRVDGNFQEIKQVLYQNRFAKRAIITGINWYEEWSYAPKGIIQDGYKELAGGHCVPIVGFKTLGADPVSGFGGTEYMVIQNSYGPDLGDGGYFYFSEEIFNKEFNQPMFMFVNLDNTVVPRPSGNALQILIKNICQLLGHR